MNCDEKESLIGSLKREIIQMPADSNFNLAYQKDDIHKIIPHRPPFSLISSISALNIQHCVIEVKSIIYPDDPIFAGHFPEEPVYPGVMQIECMGQAGLCLAYFIKNSTFAIDNNSVPVKGLFTRIHNAGFIKGVKPGNILTIRVKSIQDDDFIGLMSAQVLINNEIYSHSILEVYYP